MATKAQLEQAKNSLLASGLSIPASRHRQFEQVLIDELYDSQSRFKIMEGLTPVVSLNSVDILPVMKNGVAHIITFEDLIAGVAGGQIEDGNATSANLTGGVDLGGSMFNNVQIIPTTLGAHSMAIGEFLSTYIDSFEVYANSVIFEAVSGSGISLIHRSTYNNVDNTIRFDVSPAGVSVGAYGIYDDNFQGIEYAANYGANFTANMRSIPDVEWVLDQLANLAPALVNGSGTTVPVTGDRANLGGALTENADITSTTQNFKVLSDSGVIDLWSDTGSVRLRGAYLEWDGTQPDDSGESYIFANTLAMYADDIEFIVGQGGLAGQARFESQDTRMFFRRIDAGIDRHSSLEFTTGAAGVAHPLIQIEAISPNTSLDIQDALILSRQFSGGAPGGNNYGTKLAWSFRNGDASVQSAPPSGIRQIVVDRTHNSEDTSFMWSTLIAGLEVDIFDVTNGGMHYTSDFAGLNSVNPRWIPDKEYVDSRIEGAAPNLVNGEGTTIPGTLDRVNLGGTFTNVDIIGATGSDFDIVAGDLVLTGLDSRIVLAREVPTAQNTSIHRTAAIRTKSATGVGGNGFGTRLDFEIETLTEGVFSENAGLGYQLINNDATPEGRFTFFLHGAGGGVTSTVQRLLLDENGASYVVDHSAAQAANPRWLTDKAYVDAAILAGGGGGGGTFNAVITSATNYLLSNSDHGKLIYFTGAADATLTIPAGLRSDFRCDIGCDADGDNVTLTPSGTTLVGEGATIINPLTGASLVHLGGNAYFAVGALTENPANITKNKTVAIPAPANGDDFGFYTDRSITVTKLNDWVQGTSSPSATWNISHGSSANAVGSNLLSSSRVTTSLTGASTTTLQNTVIPAGSYVRVKVSAVSGSITQLAVTLTFLEA